jgi:hypothetical protein
MNPLIAIAVNLLPDLAKRLTGGAKPETTDLVVSVVREVLGTDDPAEARKRIADGDLSAELRVKLAEIDAAAKAQEDAAEQARRQNELDRLRAELDAEAARRDAAFRELSARMGDQQNARETFEGLAKEASPFAWGPVVVSVIVTAGFFITLVFLIRGGFGAAQTDPVVFQVVNIAVGALTAGFATVVSFWLGSSDGSRRKDLSAAQAQTAAAAMQRENAEATRRIVSEQSRQTAELLDKVTRQPPPTAPAQGAAAAASTPAAADPAAKDALQFTRCLETIFRHEGGYVDHPKDPGGATNMGITHKTLAQWRGAPVTREDVRNLTREEAGEIYRANYWNALSCDALPRGVDLVVFDFGVNAGVSRAAKLLQKIVHVEQDGQVGPITVGATKAIAADHIVTAFSDGRMDHYRSLSIWDTFKNGWTRRTNETREAALKMLRS